MAKNKEQTQTQPTDKLTEKQMEFLDIFINSALGNVSVAAKATGIRRETYYKWLQNPIFKAAAAVLVDLKGKTTTKRCICIPIEDNNLFVGEKGVYFDFILREIAEDKRQYGNTHIICQNIPKEKFEKMTEEEKKAQPILGQIKEYQAAQMQPTAEVAVEDNNDLLEGLPKETILKIASLIEPY